MDRNEIVMEVLRSPTNLVRRQLTTALNEARPDWHIVELSVYDSLTRFAKCGHCQMETVEGFREDFSLYTYRDESRIDAFVATLEPSVCWRQIRHAGASFEYVSFKVNENNDSRDLQFLTGPDLEALKTIVTEFTRWTMDLTGSVLVFDQGCWSKDEDLFNSIQSSTLNNLVLPARVKEGLVGDIQNWLNSQSLYERHGIPWKRGIILAGPPGNGKTHMIKALVNHFQIPALYVRSFVARYATREYAMAKVFERARQTTPCLLVLEDLDTLVTPDTRSFFLNEMDGFASNRGIITIATANDPARLDPALVNRPSRFDRLYTFDLPAQAERVRFLDLFIRNLVTDIKISNDELDLVGRATEGFSFAYLKELVLSGVMAWISENEAREFSVILAELGPELLRQMNLESAAQNSTRSRIESEEDAIDED